MGLLKTMEGIVSKTNNLVNSFRVKIPLSKAGDILGLEDLRDVESLSDLKDSVSEVVGVAVSTFNLVTCLFSAEGWSGMISSILFNLSTATMQILQQVFDAIAVQLRAAFNQIISSLMNFITSILNLISTILLLIDAIIGLADWFNLSWNKFRLAFNRENCAELMSSIAACYLNKFLGPLFDKIEQKLVGAVNDAGAALNNFLSEQLEDVNTMSDYLDRESFLLKKAAIQLNGLTPENVLTFGK